MTRFSVIIPTYNRKAYLQECLETVFAQTHAAHEVIVVDDGSTDGTVEVLSAKGGQIQVIRQTNAGPGAARNRGAEAASGDYLAFLDSDDLWFPWTLATFVKLIELHANPSLLFGRYVDFQTRDELSAIAEEEAAGDAYSDFLLSHTKGYFCGAGMMVISRRAFHEISGFAEDFLNAEDHDLALQLGAARGFVQVVAPITVAHRLHCHNEMADMGKTLKGIWRLVENEKAGSYPGGADRRFALQDIIARHARSAVISALREGSAKEAWPLYRATFGWNLRMGRFAYLAAAPLLALKARLKLSA